MPETEQITRSVILPLAMNRDLEAVAKAEDRSFSWVVRVAISEYLEQRRAKDKKVSRAQ